MDKQIFTYSHNIVFNNKNFVVLMSNTIPLYLLEVTKNGDLKYPKFEDYMAYYIKHYNFRGNYALAKNNLLSNNKKVSLIPKLLHKGIFISVFSAFILTGCGRKLPDSEFTSDNTDYASSYESIIDEDLQNQIKELYKSENIEVIYEDFSENIGFIHSYNTNEIVCKDLDEFKKYINLNFNPTYDDIINLVNKNDNITPDIKSIIIKGLNNMKETLPNLDLTILYTNYQTIQYKLVSANEIKEVMDESTDAYYSLYENTVYYTSDKNEFSNEYILFHEGLGHPANEIAYNKDAKSYICGNTNEVVLYDYKTNSCNNAIVGMSLSEAYADAIALSISNETIPNNYAYCSAHEYLNIISNILNKPLDKILSMKGITIYNELNKIGVNLPINYTMRLDALLNDYISGNLGNNTNVFGNIIRDLVLDAYDERLISGDKEAKEEAQNTILNSMYDEILFQYDGYRNVDVYNPQEVANIINEDMNMLYGENGYNR